MVANIVAWKGGLHFALTFNHQHNSMQGKKKKGSKKKKSKGKKGGKKKKETKEQKEKRIEKEKEMIEKEKEREAQKTLRELFNNGKKAPLNM